MTNQFVIDVFAPTSFSVKTASSLFRYAGNVFYNNRVKVRKTTMLFDLTGALGVRYEVSGKLAQDAYTALYKGTQTGSSAFFGTRISIERVKKG